MAGTSATRPKCASGCSPTPWSRARRSGRPSPASGRSSAAASCSGGTTCTPTSAPPSPRARTTPPTGARCSASTRPRLAARGDRAAHRHLPLPQLLGPDGRHRLQPLDRRLRHGRVRPQPAAPATGLPAPPGLRPAAPRPTPPGDRCPGARHRRRGGPSAGLRPHPGRRGDAGVRVRHRAGAAVHLHQPPAAGRRLAAGAPLAELGAARPRRQRGLRRGRPPGGPRLRARAPRAAPGQGAAGAPAGHRAGTGP